MKTDGARNTVEQIKLLVDVAGSVAMIVVAIVLLFAVLSQRQAGSPTGPVGKTISLDGGIAEGSPRAKVTVVTFTDFQCPYCAQFAYDTLPILREKYLDSGEVRMVFRQLPLERIHPQARLAAAMALCAANQGRFWRMHDALYAAQDRLGLLHPLEFLQPADVDPTRLQRCLSSGDANREIDRDIEEARRAQVVSTPTFLVGTEAVAGELYVHEVLVGAPSVERFDRAFRRLLEQGEGPQ